MSIISEFDEDKADHKYLDGQVISWDVEVNGNRATLGRMRLQAPVPFQMADSGERFSLFYGSPINARVPIANGNPVQIELNKPGHISFFPPSVDVEFFAEGEAWYLCEYPGQRPVRNGLVQLSHGYVMSQHLLVGDHVSGEARLDAISSLNENGVGAEIYPVQQVGFKDDDRVLLVIPNRSKDLVYTGDNPMVIKCLDGDGFIYYADLTGKNLEILAIKAGGEPVEIPSGMIFKYESSNEKLILRDTCKDFEIEKEVSLQQYLDSLDPALAVLVLANMQRSEWPFNEVPVIQSAGRER